MPKDQLFYCLQLDGNNKEQQDLTASRQHDFGDEPADHEVKETG